MRSSARLGSVQPRSTAFLWHPGGPLPQLLALRLRVVRLVRHPLPHARHRTPRRRRPRVGRRAMTDNADRVLTATTDLGLQRPRITRRATFRSTLTPRQICRLALPGARATLSRFVSSFGVNLERMRRCPGRPVSMRAQAKASGSPLPSRSGSPRSNGCETRGDLASVGGGCRGPAACDFDRRRNRIGDAFQSEDAIPGRSLLGDVLDLAGFQPTKNCTPLASACASRVLSSSTAAASASRNTRAPWSSST
jgi:hypothetical protein